MKGPPKKPTNLKILDGTAQPCRLNPDEPEYDPEIPPCPEHLGPIGRMEWHRLAPILLEKGILSTVDMAFFAEYCSAYEDVVELRNLIAEEGKIIEGFNSAGAPVKKRHPATSLLNEASKTMHRFGTEYGLSPASKTRVKASRGKSPTKDDPFAKPKAG